jgi:hypothetical protein
MGFFKGMKGSVSPDGGDSGGGGILAQLFREHSGELQGGGGGKQQYVYDASTQQFKGMKNGGTASSRADGCAVKGKTKGRMI